MITTCEEPSSNHENDGIDLKFVQLVESVENVKLDQCNLPCDHVCSTCEDTLNNKEHFISCLGIHGIHSILDKPETGKDRALSLQGITKRISTTAGMIRPFKCYLCGLAFDRISQFDNHKRSVHHQERSQVCQICGKGFFRQTDLKTHLNIHLGTNRCMCEVCGRKFNHVSNLIRHSRTHSGVKPYPCTICGKRFAQINTLARHKAIHERGDEIMDCYFCDKQYKSENGLKEHMRKLHDFTQKSNSEDNGRIIKRQHYCNICGESFQFVELLRSHETTHQNFKTFECKSCLQKFPKMDEIKEHVCGRQQLLSANTIMARKSSDQESIPIVIKDKSRSKSLRENKRVLTQVMEINNDSEEPPSTHKTLIPTENSRINGHNNCIDREFDDRLCHSATTSSEKLVENKETKETIVYVTTEQLANMNTEQVVDTANHFLHQHLMELAVENSLQTENTFSRDRDGETVVSEMINNCWKEIEMPDRNEFEVADKRAAVNSKNNMQSIIYIHALEKDGLIFLNDCANLIGNVAPDLTPEKRIDIKHDLSSIKNLSSNMEEVQNVQSIKICENEFVRKRSSFLIQNETTGKRISCNSLLNDNTNRNLEEQHHEQEQNTSVTVRAMRGLKTRNTKNYFTKDNLSKTDNLLIKTANPAVTPNVFGEVLKRNVDNVNAVIGKSSENQEPTLRLAQTETGEEFYELLITNCSERFENSFALDKISTMTVDEDLRGTPNEYETESLLKLNQLENGQRVLELKRSTSSVESEHCREVEDIEQATTNSTFIETSILENVDHDENRTKNLLQNKCEQIFYLTQNNKDTSIDFFEIETLSTQEQGSFNLVSDEVLENVSQTSFDGLQTLGGNKSLANHESPIDNDNCEDILGLIQNNVLKQNEKRKIESKKVRKEEGPMVRLVQNEDGAQFFELVRGDIEFEETQDLELVETDEFNQGQNAQLANSVKSATNLHLESICTINDTAKLESDVTRKKKQKNIARKYNCDVCKKSFSKGYNYRQHIGTHFVDQQKFQCKECGTFFAWKSTLNKHMATHRTGGQQKFVCEICPKVYTTLSQVNEHVKRDHLKERNHKCVHCAKTFFKKFDLKIHIRTHTKERPYECRVCYKSFHHQSHIIRHERIHSGEKPYACNICEKTFTQLGSLKNHRQRHQELKIDILDYRMDEDDPLPRTTL